MSIFYFHISCFVFCLISCFVFCLISCFVTFYSCSLYLSFPLFSIGSYNSSFTILLDFYSSWFASLVLLISSIIIVYSYFYMYPYSKSHVFITLTLLFVFSMLIVILVSDLLFLMLGWDGLGLISFFLIVFYQNSSSCYSGIFTLIMNRIGDCFFLCSIVLVFNFSPFMFPYSSSIVNLLTALFLLITFITKSAIFPFSPWLPMAIAAPTPISALVHSSTLVTAGLFLIMRYSYFLYQHPSLMQLLSVLSIFTSFYAGMNAIFEIDLNKLIALSTLSHLGFIGLSFSLGLINLAYFHLLVHALFKSLLFMSIGDIMINLFHSQDVRFLSSGISSTPFSVNIMYVSLLNLLGLPSLSGFFSNDLVLETLNYSSCSFFIILILFINVFFTYFYTFQLFYYSFSPVKFSPYVLQHAPSLLHSSLITLLGIISVLFGNFYLNNVLYFLIFPSVPLFTKLLPFMICFLVFSSLLFLENFPVCQSSPVFLYFSTIMFLFPFMSISFSRFYYSYSFNAVNSVEYGALNYLLNSSVYNIYLLISNNSFSYLSINPFSVLYVTLILLFPLLLLS